MREQRGEGEGDGLACAARRNGDASPRCGLRGGAGKAGARGALRRLRARRVIAPAGSPAAVPVHEAYRRSDTAAFATALASARAAARSLAPCASLPTASASSSALRCTASTLGPISFLHSAAP